MQPPGQHLECSNWEILSQNHQLSFSWTLLTHRKLWDDIFIIILNWYTFGGICHKEQMTKIFINHILLITEFLLILFFKYFLSIAHLSATIVVLISKALSFLYRLLQYFPKAFLPLINSSPTSNSLSMLPSTSLFKKISIWSCYSIAVSVR